jgi:hypothetical protein
VVYFQQFWPPCLAAVLGGENAVFRPEFLGAKNSLSLKMPGTASV